MMFMNEYEVEETVLLAARYELPQAMEAAMTLTRLVNWANRNSDGWCYWPKPCRAAKGLQELLSGMDRFDPDDLDPADVRRAYGPIKAFLTRQGVDHGKVFLPAGWAEEAMHQMEEEVSVW